jgi:hypothetical protein
MAVTSEIGPAASTNPGTAVGAGSPPGAATDPEPRILDPGSPIPDPGQNANKKRDLKAEAMSSSDVQAMLDVFPAEIRDVEEM